MGKQVELILIHLLLISEPGIVAGRVVTTVTLVDLQQLLVWFGSHVVSLRILSPTRHVGGVVVCLFEQIQKSMFFLLCKFMNYKNIWRTNAWSVRLCSLELDAWINEPPPEDDEPEEVIAKTSIFHTMGDDRWEHPSILITSHGLILSCQTGNKCKTFFFINWCRTICSKQMFN